jgi:hypothetical protein
VIRLKTDELKPGMITVFEAELETKETIEKELKAKFADVIDDPIMQKIMKAAGRQLQKSLIDPEKENEPN